MAFMFNAFGLAILLFVGMLAFGEIGRRLALRRARLDPDGAWHGYGTVDGAVFALLGLVIAFSFSGAVSRFDERRSLIVTETNAIGTAYLRLDLLAADARADLRADLRAYLDTRIRGYQKLPDVAAALAEMAQSQRLQAEIWSKAIAATDGSQQTRMLLLPALNEVFDIATTRTMMAQKHPPAIIFEMLFGLSFIAAGLAGYGMAKSVRREWVRSVSLAAVMSIVSYVIYDIEYPREGLISISAFDHALLDLRASMQ